MTGPGTVREALRWGTSLLRDHGIEAPRLTTELLLADCLNTDRMKLLLKRHRELSNETVLHFRRSIDRRINRVPLEYITNRAEFFSRPFRIDERSMIPRPETEVLVEKALELLPEATGPDESAEICDLGTGSGVILITMLLENPGFTGLGIDVSDEALELAEENARRHGVRDRITFLNGDFLSSELRNRLSESGPFDAILTNPPYIDPEEFSELQPEVRKFEPEEALRAPCDRRELYRRLCELSVELCRTNGLFLMEMSEFDRPSPDRFQQKYAFSRVDIVEDHRNVPRILIGRL